MGRASSSAACSVELDLRVEPTLGTTLDAEGRSELDKTIDYGWRFLLDVQMNRLSDVRRENRELRRKLRRRSA